VTTAAKTQEVARKSTLTYLDSYERAVASFAELHVRAAKATKAPFLVDIAEAQAELSRELASVGAGATRALLED
jgi:hypothetical protein